MTTGSSPARGLGIAPAAGGLLGLFLGSFVAARLTQSTSTPDEAAIRLFAAFFLLFGLLFLGDAIRGLRTRAGLRTRLGPLPTGLAAGIVTGVAIAFHYAWTAPWSLFQWLVLFLDVLAVILFFLFMTRLLAARRGTTPPRPQPLSANKAAARRQRFGFLAILFGTLGLLVGWLGMKQATSDWRGWSSAVRVEGVVTRQLAYNFRGRDGRPALNSAVVIRYQADGKSYETTQRIDPTTSAQYGKNATVRLLYDPASPSRGRLVNAFETFLISGSLLMLTVLFLGLGGMAAARAAESVAGT
jgi:hypothetical protein